MNDCPDGSDERNCDLISIPSTYHKGAPPSHTTPFDISLRIRIFSILELSDANSEMRVKFVTQMRWRDPRLSYNNLKEDKNDSFHKFKNRVTDEQAKDIWYPRIIFLNTDKRIMTKVSF